MAANTGGRWRKRTDTATGEAVYEPLDNDARIMSDNKDSEIHPKELVRSYQSSNEVDVEKILQKNEESQRQLIIERKQVWGPWLTAEASLKLYEQLQDEALAVYHNIFETYCTNINDVDVITRNSFYVMARHYCVAFGMRDQWDTVWDHLDYKKEGVVTRASFVLVLVGLDPETKHYDHLGNAMLPSGELDLKFAHIPTLNRLKQIYRFFDEDKLGLLDQTGLSNLLRTISNLADMARKRSDLQLHENVQYNLSNIDEDRVEYLELMQSHPDKIRSIIGEKSSEGASTESESHKVTRAYKMQDNWKNITRDSIKQRLELWSGDSPINSQLATGFLGDSDCSPLHGSIMPDEDSSSIRSAVSESSETYLVPMEDFFSEDESSSVSLGLIDAFISPPHKSNEEDEVLEEFLAKSWSPSPDVGKRQGSFKEWSPLLCMSESDFYTSPGLRNLSPDGLSGSKKQNFYLSPDGVSNSKKQNFYLSADVLSCSKKQNFYLSADKGGKETLYMSAQKIIHKSPTHNEDNNENIPNIDKSYPIHRSPSFNNENKKSDIIRSTKSDSIYNSGEIHKSANCKGDSIPNSSIINSGGIYNSGIINSGSIHNSGIHSSGGINRNSIHKSEGIHSSGIQNSGGMFRRSIHNSEGIHSSGIHNNEDIYSSSIHKSAGIHSSGIHNSGDMFRSNIHNSAGIISSEIQNSGGKFRRSIHNSEGIHSSGIHNSEDIYSSSIHKSGGIHRSTSGIYTSGGLYKSGNHNGSSHMSDGVYKSSIFNSGGINSGIKPVEVSPLSSVNNSMSLSSLTLPSQNLTEVYSTPLSREYSTSVYTTDSLSQQHVSSYNHAQSSYFQLSNSLSPSSKPEDYSKQLTDVMSRSDDHFTSPGRSYTCTKTPNNMSFNVSQQYSYHHEHEPLRESEIINEFTKAQATPIKIEKVKEVQVGKRSRLRHAWKCWSKKFQDESTHQAFLPDKYDRKAKVLLRKYEGTFGFNAFVKCVCDGDIKNTKYLFRLQSSISKIERTIKNHEELSPSAMPTFFDQNDQKINMVNSQGGFCPSVQHVCSIDPQYADQTMYQPEYQPAYPSGCQPGFVPFAKGSPNEVRGKISGIMNSSPGSISSFTPVREEAPGNMTLQVPVFNSPSLRSNSATPPTVLPTPHMQSVVPQQAMFIPTAHSPMQPSPAFGPHNFEVTDYHTARELPHAADLQQPISPAHSPMQSSMPTAHSPKRLAQSFDQQSFAVKGNDFHTELYQPTLQSPIPHQRFGTNFEADLGATEHNQPNEINALTKSPTQYRNAEMQCSEEVIATESERYHFEMYNYIAPPVTMRDRETGTVTAEINCMGPQVPAPIPPTPMLGDEVMKIVVNGDVLMMEDGSAMKANQYNNNLYLNQLEIGVPVAWESSMSTPAKAEDLAEEVIQQQAAIQQSPNHMAAKVEVMFLKSPGLRFDLMNESSDGEDFDGMRLWQPLLTEMTRLNPNLVYECVEDTTTGFNPSNNLVFAIVDNILGVDSVNKKEAAKDVLQHPCLEICVSYLIQIRRNERFFPLLEPKMHSKLSGLDVLNNSADFLKTVGVINILNAAFDGGLKKSLEEIGILKPGAQISLPTDKIILFSCFVSHTDREEDILRGVLLILTIKLLAPKNVHMLRCASLFNVLARMYLSNSNRETSPVIHLLNMWLSLPYATSLIPEYLIGSSRRSISFLILPSYPVAHKSGVSKTSKFKDLALQYNKVCNSDLNTKSNLALKQIIEERFGSFDNWCLTDVDALTNKKTHMLKIFKNIRSESYLQVVSGTFEMLLMKK